MIYLILYFSFCINLFFSYILFRVWKEKKLKYDLDRITYANDLNNAWCDLITELNTKRVRVNRSTYHLIRDELYRSGYVSSLVELRKDFEEENKHKVFNYSFKKELKE